ncbi:MAG: Serine/threonine kinase [Myxococcaceae bacterium]|nr:Serine/threonine kinase [Myxococcaceae bacterium]
MPALDASMPQAPRMALSSDAMSATELRGGRYVLVKPLGEGTQGETFEAVDKRGGRLVAVKRFRVGKAKAWKDVELAEREATTLASLQHDLLPRYVEHFEEEGALVLVMERIEGESLAELRKKGFVASVSDVQRLLADASRALAYLHGRAPPVIHRDLKPGNVIRRPDGSYAFVDFGAVRDRLKLAGGSTIVGTFGYMAPEQFQGRASAASDVYGIGATALTLLTGCEPEDLPHKGLGIDVAKAVPATTPSSLVRTLEAMLDPDPDTRASSVAEAIARGGGGGDRPLDPARTSSTRPPPRRSRRDERDERDDARRARRAGRHRSAPFPLRVVAWLGLLLARMVVWLVVGITIPLVLSLLSLAFGKALQRASDACRRASSRAGSAMNRATRRMAGEDDRESETGEERRVRIAEVDVLRRIRAVTPEQAQREAMLVAERNDPEDAEEWAARKAAEEADLWEPPQAWLEREQREREEEAERARERREREEKRKAARRTR